MKKLIEGIKVFTSLDKEKRILISSGTQKVDTLNDVPCSRTTFIPKHPWREPHQIEKELIFATNEDKELYQTVGIVRLNKDIEQKINTSRLRSIQSPEEFSIFKKNEDFTKILDEINLFAKKYQIVDEAQIVNGIHAKHNSTIATTWDNESKFFIGLHLDSWDPESLNLRHLSRNRICFNLGTNDRFFMFVNLPIIQLAQMQEHLDLYSPSVISSTIVNFFTLYPNYPIIKIRIKPFEAYIAPTENIIHDGCSSTNHTMDINYTLRSYYGLIA